MGIQLCYQSSHIIYQLSHLVIESVYLCGITDDGTEGIQIVVELPLQVGSGFHLLLRPYMTCGNKHHHLLLVLQLLLRLFCVRVNHPRKDRVILCPYPHKG